MGEYVYKWKKPDGKILTLKQYNALYQASRRRNVDFIKYMKQKGIKKNLSYGETQNPVNNSAKLVGWLREEEGEIRLLTLWRYNQYFDEARKRNVNIKELLNGEGFIKLGEYTKDGDNITRWINSITGEILLRKEYQTLFRRAKREKMDIVELLTLLGYVKILDSKK